VVMSSESIPTSDPRFAGAGEKLAAAIAKLPRVRAVDTPWNTPRPELLGKGGHVALVVVVPSVHAYLEADRFTADLRGAIAEAALPPEVRIEVTGTTAAIHAM